MHFMGTSIGGGVLSKSDVVPANEMSPHHMPKSVLKDSTVRIFGDTAVLMGTGGNASSAEAGTDPPDDRFSTHGDGWQVIAVHRSKSE
jgi:hypothetical protein